MNETREYIIDQAYKLFLSQSYEAVSISDISKSVELTKGALYHHFTNKEELFKAVIDKYLNIIGMNISEKDATVEELIEAIIKQTKKVTKDMMAENDSLVPLSFISLMIDAFRHYPEFEKEKLDIFKLEVEKIKRVLDKAIKRKEIRSDINTGVMATNFFSLTISIAYQLLHGNSPKKAINYLKEQLTELHKLIKI